MEEIKEIIKKNELSEAIDLINDVFREYVAVDYSEEGQQTFQTYLKNKFNELQFDLYKGHKKMWGYYIDNKIIGVIASRDTSHISLLFVAKEYHRKGIAKQLFHTLKQNVIGQNINTITVNSSPFAVPVYQHLGFTATDQEKELNGIRYIPMEYTY